MKELAETDRVKKLQKKEELRRMLVPMKRNKWQRMSLRRKVCLFISCEYYVMYVFDI